MYVSAIVRKCFLENIIPVQPASNIPQLALWKLLHQTYKSVSRCEYGLFTTIGLTDMQHAILMTIKQVNTPVNPTYIAEQVDRNLNTVTLIIERMAKKGLIVRTRDADDQRSYEVVITEKGKEYLKRSSPKSSALIMKVLETLSAEELQTLTTLLEKIRLQAIQCNRKEKILRKYSQKKP
jgi:DNA-binding MarR family transcriptional regulator